MLSPQASSPSYHRRRQIPPNPSPTLLFSVTPNPKLSLNVDGHDIINGLAFIKLVAEDTDGEENCPFVTANRKLSSLCYVSKPHAQKLLLIVIKSVVPLFGSSSSPKIMPPKY